MRSQMLVLLGAALLSACASRGGQDDGIVCTLEARSSFAVTVVDAVTGENLAPDATVRVTDGSFSQMLEAMAGTGVYGGVYERPGTYTVVVSHPGYQQWQRAGVEVESDECHVITEQVEARLTPS